jgi:Tol biopolymer transport system component
MTGLRPRGFLAALMAVSAVALAAPPVAGATFPGRNGRIAYVRVSTLGGPGLTGPLSTQSEVVSILPNGGGRRTLLGPGVDDYGSELVYSYPAYSPSGRKLAFALFNSTGRFLYLVRANGHGRPRRLTYPPWPSQDSSPSWAPDGRRLVYTRNRELRVYRAGKSRPINSAGEGIDPVWSVRRRIAFVTAATTLPAGIYTIRPDGSHGRHVVLGHHPDWSPDGRWVVFAYPSSPVSGGEGIAMVRRDGRHRRVITTDGRDPAFSPNGRYIVFARYDAAIRRHTLVAMRLRDDQTRTIVTDTAEIDSPNWQPLRRRKHR